MGDRGWEDERREAVVKDIAADAGVVEGAAGDKEIATIRRELAGREYYGLANDRIKWLLAHVDALVADREALLADLSKAAAMWGEAQKRSEDLDARVGVLEGALREQWKSNHDEHCRGEWPHEGHCYWPLPAVLAGGEAAQNERDLADFRASAAGDDDPFVRAVWKADAAASKAHDAIWTKPFDQKAASDAIWEVHNWLRPMIPMSGDDEEPGSRPGGEAGKEKP